MKHNLLTILMIEDVETDRDLTRLSFGKADIASKLHIVKDGEEAIDYLKGERIYFNRDVYKLPHVILLDLNLPKLNGFKFLVWLRSQPKIKRILVIILTNSLRSEDVDRAYECGADGFLIKPTRLDELINMTVRMKNWFELNHLYDPNGD